MGTTAIDTKSKNMNYLVRLRKNSGLSQKDVADYIGVSRSLVNLAEKALRELPKEAKAKLADLEDLVNAPDFNKKPVKETFDDEGVQEFKTYHQLKMRDFLFKAEGLRRRLKVMVEAQQKAALKFKLVNGLSNSNTKNSKNKMHAIWTKNHELQSGSKLKKSIPAIRMLTYDIEVLMGYAAVHEKILKKIF